MSESSQMAIFNKKGGSDSSVVLLFGLTKDRLYSCFCIMSAEHKIAATRVLAQIYPSGQAIARDGIQLVIGL